MLVRNGNGQRNKNLLVFGQIFARQTFDFIPRHSLKTSVDKMFGVTTDFGQFRRCRRGSSQGADAVVLVVVVVVKYFMVGVGGDLQQFRVYGIDKVIVKFLSVLLSVGSKLRDKMPQRKDQTVGRKDGPFPRPQHPQYVVHFGRQ